MNHPCPRARRLGRVSVGLCLVVAQVVALPLAGDRFSSPVQAAPSMTVVKSSVPPSGSTVSMGDTIIYSIDVTNDGDEVLTGLEVTDVLPDGVTYVANSATITGARESVRYLDGFDERDYDRDNDTVDEWIEINDDNSATNGDVRIVADTDQNPDEQFVLEIEGDAVGIRREIPLSNCGPADISFDWRPRENLVPNNETYLEFSADGINWVRQPAVFNGSQSTTYTAFTQSIPAAFLVADAEVRFITSTSNGRRMYVDNFDVTQVCGLVAPGTSVGAAPASSLSLTDTRSTRVTPQP